MAKQHCYAVTTTWTGNLGSGTAGYRAYSRDHAIAGAGKQAPIPGSSDPHFRGDGARYNPEELLVSALSACHMLWVLHLCADAGIVITEYADEASGVMRENPDGSGEFASVVLRPKMSITEASRMDEALRLHDKAHEMCFIARSVKFPVTHEASIMAHTEPRP